MSEERDRIREAIDGEVRKMGADVGMRRTRPYDGQPWTDEGVRGRTEIKGITFRDLRDCFIRAVMLSAHHVVPDNYEEATRGEAALLCANDLFGVDLDKLDPLAIAQNLSCEVERAMGIFPNIPKLTYEETMAHVPMVDIGPNDPKKGSAS